MRITRKEAYLIISIFIITVSLNAVGGIVLKVDPVNLDRPQRASATFGNVEILHNKNTEDRGYIDDDNISLYWFIHVTDTHLSADINAYRNQMYQRFLNYSYDYMHPFTVIHTGDIAQGQDRRNFTEVDHRVSTGFKNYFELVNNTKYANDLNPYRYLEIAGNHDRNCDWNAEYFLNYTFAGRNFGTIQNFFTANFSQGSAGFSLIDSAAPLAAPPVPFGSEGNMGTQDLKEYVDFLKFSQDADTKLTFQHHHPLETFGLYKDDNDILFKGINTFNAENDVDATFYGHTHMRFEETYGDIPYIMGDIWRQKYTDETTGERYGLYFNLIAVDGGGITYIDQSSERFPYILITNPTNPLFLDSDDSITSTHGDRHVRVLVFPNETDPIDTVEYRINGGEWLPMAGYNGSQILYESSRGTLTKPEYAMPDSTQDCEVQVKVTTNSGKLYYQSAIATSEPKRIPHWETILISIIITMIGIVAFINRDNFPLKRYDGAYRSLSHDEKVKKRKHKNVQRKRPWWLPYLGWTVFISILIIPWGVLPIFGGSSGAVYTFFTINSHGILFLPETMMYTSLRIVFVLPCIYWGIRTYWPDVVQTGVIINIISAGVAIYVNYYHFLLPGLLLPGIYFDIAISIIIAVGNFPHTIIAKGIKRLVTRKTPQ